MLALRSKSQELADFYPFVVILVDRLTWYLLMVGACEVLYGISQGVCKLTRTPRLLKQYMHNFT